MGHIIKLMECPVGLIPNVLKVVDQVVEIVDQIRRHGERGRLERQFVAYHKIVAATAFQEVIPQTECLIHNHILVAVAWVVIIPISCGLVESMDQVSEVIEGLKEIPCHTEG